MTCGTDTHKGVFMFENTTRVVTETFDNGHIKHALYYRNSDTPKLEKTFDDTGCLIGQNVFLDKEDA